MISHIFIGVQDFERAYAFYDALFQLLCVAPRFVDRQRPWAGWQSTPGPRPLFVIGKPADGEVHTVGNGQMVGFRAETRAEVDRAYALALSFGAQSEGAPGLRPEYHANFYGAYFRDTEGNKLCVACHVAESP